MSTTTAPDDKTINEAYVKQDQSRYLYIENPIIDEAFGVWDYDADMWITNPYVSVQTAKSLCISKNKGATRL